MVHKSNQDTIINQHEQTSLQSTETTVNLKGDLLFTAILGLLVFYLLIEALDYKFMSKIAPYVVMVPLMLLIIIHIIRLLRQVSWTEFKTFLGQIILFKNEQHRKFMGIIGWTITLMLLIYIAGFYVGATVFLFVLLKLIANERWVISVVLTIVIPLSLYGVFELMLGNRLFRGIIYSIMNGHSVF